MYHQVEAPRFVSPPWYDSPFAVCVTACTAHYFKHSTCVGTTVVIFGAICAGGALSVDVIFVRADPRGHQQVSQGSSDGAEPDGMELFCIPGSLAGQNLLSHIDALPAHLLSPFAPGVPYRLTMTAIPSFPGFYPHWLI